MEENWSITSLDIMEPAMKVHDELEVIYINEAFAEKLQDPESEESAQYRVAQEAHPKYGTRLRKMPVTIEYMERYCSLMHDTFMLDLIERKREVLARTDETFEMSSFNAFKNMFLAKYPQASSVYKTIKRMDAFEERKSGAEG
ncbi:MAG: hypothetical protein K5637_05855 [Lachnospiraceae bacterium]|nr:hypothetical protein [Lachnospiraceae bacterium]